MNTKKLVSIVMLMSFFLTGVLGCTSGSSKTGANANTNETVASQTKQELRLSTYFADSHCTNQYLHFPVSAELKEASEGSLNISIFSNGVLGPAATHYDMAVDGVADITQGTQGTTAGRFPLTSVLELPFLWPADMSAENANRAVWALFENTPELQEEYRDVKVLSIFVNEPGNVYTSKKPIKTLEDFKGLQLRAPMEMAANTLKALSASPITMAASDLYLALERNTVDGTMFNTANMNDWKFWEVVDHYTQCGIYNLAWFSVMNLDKYNSLSDEQKALIDERYGLNAGIRVGQGFDADFKKNVEIAEENGVTIYKISDEELARWQTITQPIYDNWVKSMEDKGLPGQKVLDEIRRLIEEYHYYGQ